VVECPGQKTKTVNQHGTSIDLGKNIIYVSCLSGVATWYVETKHLTLLALLYKFPAVESSAQLYQRYKPSAVEVWDNLFRGSNPVAVPEREGWDNLGAPYMSQMYYMKGRYNKIQLITRHP
jgi:hypothetical protein